MILFFAIVLTTEIPSRGSREAEETAQVAGTGDNHQGKVGDVEAGMQNRVWGPASNSFTGIFRWSLAGSIPLDKVHAYSGWKTISESSDLKAAM
jgi:hypothetical protein